MKIAIVGSAPSTVTKAPYRDPDWQVWGCSPGAYPHASQHADAWFEIHNWDPKKPAIQEGKPWFSVEYHQVLKQFQGKVYMNPPLPADIPNAVAFPFQDLVNEFGPFFFTSSIAWMLALAIKTPGVTEIGLWGVDMSANEEYSAQRPGCHHFLQIAMERGIEITVPPESDLLQPPPLYGYLENTPMGAKLQARMAEFNGRLQALDQEIAAKQNERFFLQGAKDDLQYMINTWTTHQAVINPPAGVSDAALYGMDDMLSCPDGPIPLDEDHRVA